MSEQFEMVKEVAVTSGKVLDTVNNFGVFISKYIGGTFEQGIGIFEDKLRYMRWERQVRLMQRAKDFMLEIGLDEPDKVLKLNHAIPLLQAASLEEDDYLQDLWAKLLVNSCNSSSGVELHRAYIDILERISPLEAHILELIYRLPFEEIEHKGVLTHLLPTEVTVKEKGSSEVMKLENDEVILALSNLARLGCINPSLTWSGALVFDNVNPTLLGKYLVDSYKLR